MEAWYSIHAKARQERLAAEHLVRQGYRVHLPMIRAPRRRRGHWDESLEPLFPGYLFIYLDLATHNSAPIRSTRGVVGLVRFGGKIPKVPDDLIEGLLADRTDAEGVIGIHPSPKPGDRVAVVSGPLAGLEAIFLSACGEERANILLELLGREHRVSVPRRQLAPAE